MSRQFPALRGLAIAVVVLHHSILMGTLYPLELGYLEAGGVGRWALLVLQGLGVFAVPAFLFISGSFAAYAARGNPVRFKWTAVSGTLNRILWPYLLWSLAYYVVAYFLRAERNGALATMRNLLVGYPYHFVPLLVFWYLLSPVLIAVITKPWGWSILIIVGLMQAAVLNLVLPGVIGFEFPAWVRTVIPRYYNSVFADWGIYFPLGAFCGINRSAVVPWVRRLRWPLAAAMAAFFAVHVLSLGSVLRFWLAGHICPIAFVFLSLLINRRWIPAVRTLERIGKRSYGLYLVHLCVLWAAVSAAELAIPWLFRYQMMLHPALFFSALGAPLLLMSAAGSLLPGKVYRFVFG